MKKIIGMLVLVAALALSSQAMAAMTFTASVTNANGTLNTTLNWDATGATSCTASGHSSWTGSKPVTGSQTLPAISQSGSYTLTLTCAFPGDTTATLSWVAPTTNLDGTALAKCPDQNPGNPCLLQYKVYTSTTTPINPAQATFRLIDDRNATGYVWNGLTAGNPRYFAVVAINGLFAESPLSNEALKVISTTSSQNSSVTLTVNPIPGKPTNLTVQ